MGGIVQVRVEFFFLPAPGPIEPSSPPFPKTLSWAGERSSSFQVWQGIRHRESSVRPMAGKPMEKSTRDKTPGLQTWGPVKGRWQVPAQRACRTRKYRLAGEGPRIARVAVIRTWQSLGRPRLRKSLRIEGIFPQQHIGWAGVYPQIVSIPYPFIRKALGAASIMSRITSIM